MTHLAASIFVRSVEQAVADAAVAAERGADLVEYRIDQFTDHPPAVSRLVERSPLPCIVTCRPTWEGGEYDGDEQTRISLLEQVGLGESRPAYIDLELAAYQSSANLRQKVNLVIDHPEQVRPTDTGLILSSHDFESRPADLYQRVEAMALAPACRVIKVAWKARSLRDNLEAFEILAHRAKPAIALCMGEYGLPSRVLAKKFGALLTFAAVDDDAGTAPGQPTIDQLKRLYRWDAIDEATRVYGVIGHPVVHSRSPAIHNAGFAAAQFNGVYLPLPILPAYESFKATLIALLDYPPLHFSGASVTIPHKENLLRFVREMGGEVDPLAQRIGAANTLTVREGGGPFGPRLHASNTDYAAALDAVCDGMGISREELSNLRIAVLGAGGAARAIVAGFAQAGASVVLYNRTFDKAKALAEAFADLPGKVVPARWEKLCDSCCQVYINCTPVGMFPDVNQSPMPKGKRGKGQSGWGPGTVVFDTIYNPPVTKLLEEAHQAGCVTIPGAEMFIRQAAGQFEQWTGKSAPILVFRGVLGGE